MSDEELKNALGLPTGSIIPRTTLLGIIAVKEAMEQKDTAAIREELGDLMFSVVNLSRYLGHEPEEVLNENIAKFMRRFQSLENLLRLVPNQKANQKHQVFLVR